FAVRKRLLQYDDVLNQQREVVYGIRNAAIHSERPKEIIFEQVEEELVTRLGAIGFGEKAGLESAALESFVGWVNSHFPIGFKIEELSGGDAETQARQLLERVKKAYAVKESAESSEGLAVLERYVVINAIDHHWQEHLTEMEDLRNAIYLRSYGQKDPLVEYKSEAYQYFEELMNNVRLQICTGLFRSASNLQSFENMLALLSRTARTLGPDNAPPVGPASAPPQVSTRMIASGGGATAVADPPAAENDIKLPAVTVRREFPKVGRNDPCPCGSGKKYKHCHGA
ncbi:MAG: SEC-C domain-containing protein, partial [Verrucomicrobiota bacterium]|nr:SEC-C domain-containing protein [Verrucomicrobiota bacterium]